jgi:replicative DNA helicase
VSLLAEHTPPNEGLSERAILEIAFRWPRTQERIFEALTADSFYWPTHRDVFAAMLTLRARREPVDLVTVSCEVGLEHAGPVSAIYESNAELHHLEAYIERLIEKQQMRALIAACADIAADARECADTAREVLDRAHARILGLTQEQATSGLRDLAEGIAPFLSRLEEQAKLGCAAYRGLPTGFSGLDALTQGIGPCDLWFIGARPAFGKTSLAHDIVRRWSIEKPHPDACCAIFSLEMSFEEVFSRIAHAHARIPAAQQREALSILEFERMDRAIRADFERGSVFVDSTTHKLDTILSRARRLAATRRNLSLIIVDHIGLVVPPRKGNRSRENEVSETAMAFKHLAMELSVPLLVCSQLSRSADNRPMGKPTMGDLKDSGALEADADAVMLLWRPDKYGVKDAPENGAVLILAKNRHGPVGEVQLQFNAALSSYENPQGGPR